MLLLTIGVVFVLFVISFLLFDKDLLAPPTAVALVFLFGTLCCFYNEKRWGLEFSPKSLGLIAAGIIATMIGGLIGLCLSNFPKVGSLAFSHEKTQAPIIYVSPIKIVVVVLIQLITLYMVYTHVRNVSGYSNWVPAVTRYRALVTYANIDDTSTRMPFITRNLKEFSWMLGTVYAYIVGNNLIASKKKLSLNWLPIIMYTLTTFMLGDRSNAIRLWVVLLVVAYTIHKRSVGWKKNRETKKLIRMMVISVIAVGAAFAGFRELVGRESSLDPLAYVTFYAGSPIAVLNQVWEGPIVKPDVFGQRILYYFNQTTTVFFGWPGPYKFYYDFMRSPSGVSIGNAPTAFRPAFVEFGFFGFSIFFIACGAFFTYLYCKCRNRRGKGPIDFRLLVYAFISYVFLMYFYSTFFDFISNVFIKYMIEMWLIQWMLTGWQFRGRKQIKFIYRSRIESNKIAGS